nr:reverse transcriptase domain-containing protein [Tanacetum cinerariifolium]
RQKRNEDLCTELEYFSEEYDEEREMEPRPVRNKETTLILCTRVERNSKGGRPSGLGADNDRSQGMNLPLLLAARLNRNKNGVTLGQSLNYHPYAQNGNPSFEGTSVQRQKRNEDLCTELEYFSEEYDEEREMEPRPVRNKETTLILCTRVERNSKGGRPSGLGADNDRSQGMNLPLLLAARLNRNKNGYSLQSSLTSVHGGPLPSINTGGNLPPNGVTLGQSLNYHPHAQNGNPSFEGTFVQQNFGHTLASKRSLQRRTSQHTTLSREKAKALEPSSPDHGHDTNDWRKLRHQIEEAVKLRQLSHLMKGIKKGKAKASDTQRGRKPFNIEHKLNEYKHIKPVKQKKHGLGHDRNAAACKENARATYQRLVDKVFNDQIGQNIEAYVDDMEGPFLGHLITKPGIRANPSKVKAVTDLEPPRTLKDVQSINRKLAALSRFLSKGAEKSLPFFKTLKSYTDKTTIQWTMDAEEVHGNPSNTYCPNQRQSVSNVPHNFSQKHKRRSTCRKRKETSPNLFCEHEYEALLAGLRITREMEIRSLTIFANSQLMVNQIKGLFEAKQPTIKQYLQKVKEILKGFDTYTIEHIRRNQNKKTDALSKLASMNLENLTKEVLVEVLVKRSIDDNEVSKVEAEKG